MYCVAQRRCRGLKVVPYRRVLVFLGGDFMFTSSNTCGRLYHLATKDEKADWHQKWTSVRYSKYVNFELTMAIPDNGL